MRFRANKGRGDRMEPRPPPMFGRKENLGGEFDDVDDVGGRKRLGTKKLRKTERMK